MDEALERQLPETGEPALDVRDPEPVVESRVRVVVRNVADDSVRVQEPEPDPDLDEQIERPRSGARDGWRQWRLTQTSDSRLPCGHALDALLAEAHSEVWISPIRAFLPVMTRTVPLRRRRCSISCVWRHKWSGPALVVDLGSGTGLSTRVWADRADEVVGVEASEQMRVRAEEATAAANVRFVQAFARRRPASRTRRPTSSRARSPFTGWSPSRRWPRSRGSSGPGGVFAAYDYDWPPVVHWEVERAFDDLVKRLGEHRGEKRRPRYGEGRPPRAHGGERPLPVHARGDAPLARSW